MTTWLKFQALVFEPGHYKTNFRAFRLREMVRWYGWYRGIDVWLKTRTMPASRTAAWMPGLWAENECKPEDLTSDFWQATKPHRADFEKLGCVQCRLAKQTRLLNPGIRDNGAIFYLDPARRIFGQLLYSRRGAPSREKAINEITITFTAVFEGNTLSCTNTRKTFDSADTGSVIRLNSFDVPEIYKRFQEELKRRRDQPRSFPDVQSLRQWFDQRQQKNFEDWGRRRLFIPMTESEVEAAKAATQRKGSELPHTWFRRRFQVGLWPILIILLIVLRFFMHRQLQTPSDTVDYQGQQFKMRLHYASCEDYKDDPNNLDINELGRIEQSMESVKIPATFKNRDEFIHFVIFDLGFPGYGVGGIGANLQTDDGSMLDAESVEIPQADKDRVVIVRESGGNWKLLDDFIYNTATNSISNIRLKNKRLQYFDDKGRQVREKPL